MNLYWQSIKFLRPIYIDWFIHRIETVVNKCTVVRAAPRISPFTTESPEKKQRKKRKKRKKRKRRIEREEREEERRERKARERKKRRNLESDRARGVVISVQIARVRIRHGVWKRRGTNERRNERWTNRRWTLDRAHAHPRRILASEKKNGGGRERKRKERRNEVVPRWKKYKKKKNERVNKDRPVSHARDHCYYISRGVLFPWENWTGPFYHL